MEQADYMDCDHVIYTYIYTHVSKAKPLLYYSESLTVRTKAWVHDSNSQTQQLRQLEDVFLNNTVLDSQLNTVNFNNQF